MPARRRALSSGPAAISGRSKRVKAPSSPSTSPTPQPKADAEARRQQRLVRNRLSAQQHREKLQRYREALEARAMGVAAERDAARAALTAAAARCTCGGVGDICAALADTAPPMPPDPSVKAKGKKARGGTSSKDSQPAAAPPAARPRPRRTPAQPPVRCIPPPAAPVLPASQVPLPAAVTLSTPTFPAADIAGAGDLFVDAPVDDVAFLFDGLEDDAALGLLPTAFPGLDAACPTPATSPPTSGDEGSVGSLSGGSSSSPTSSLFLLTTVFAFGLMLGPFAASIPGALYGAVPSTLAPDGDAANGWVFPAGGMRSLLSVEEGLEDTARSAVPGEVLVPHFPMAPLSEDASQAGAMSKALSLFRPAPTPKQSTPPPQSVPSHDPSATGAMSSAIAMAQGGLRGAPVSDAQLVAAGATYGRAIAHAQAHTHAVKPPLGDATGIGGAPELSHALQTYANAALVSYSQGLRSDRQDAPGGANASYIMCPEAVGVLSERLKSAPPPPSDLPLVPAGGPTTGAPRRSPRGTSPVNDTPYFLLMTPAASLQGLDAVSDAWAPEGVRDAGSTSTGWVEIGCEILSVRRVHSVELRA